jgi:hypothetical protein
MNVNLLRVQEESAAETEDMRHQISELEQQLDEERQAYEHNRMSVSNRFIFCSYCILRPQDKDG